jgi:hypothetical protein
MAIRDRAQRARDVLERLQGDVDLWVATVQDDGSPYLIPLSFVWDGARILMATPATSITTRNLLRSPRARVALGPTRDVVMIDAEVDVVELDSEPDLAELHASRAGFDARTASERFVLLIATPLRIQAWRTPEELPYRLVMKDGEWLESSRA